MDLRNKIRAKTAEILLILAMVVIILMLVWRPTTNLRDDIVIPVDTTYDKAAFDSIDVIINRKDSVIKDLTIKFKEDVKQSYTISDSATIELFYRLLSDNRTNFLYGE